MRAVDASSGLTRRAAVAAGAAALTTACGQVGGPRKTAFEGFLESLTQAALMDAPEQAVLRGAPVQAAPAALTLGLDGRSMRAEELRRTAMLRWAAQLAGFAPEMLTPNERVSHRALSMRLDAARACAEAPFGRLELFDGYRPYAITPGAAAFETAPRVLDTARADTVADAQALLERFSRLPQAILDELACVEADARWGIRLPGPAVERLQAALARDAALPPGGETMRIVRARLLQLPQTETATRMVLAAERVAKEVSDAQARLAAALPRLTADATAGAMSTFPGGRELYSAMLMLKAGLAIDPQAALAQAQEELRSVEAKADMALRGLGRAEGPVARRLAAFAAETAPADPAGGVLALPRGVAEACVQAARRLFAAPPQAWPLLKIDPRLRARAQYEPARLDGRAGAAFAFAAPPARLDAPSLVTGVWLGLHPAMERARTNDALPLVRQLCRTPGYAGGITAYAEDLADEIGLLGDDPAARLGLLANRLHGIARAIADLSLHTGVAGALKAAEILAQTTGAPPETAARDIEDLLLHPGVAAAAEHGRRTVHTAREAARSRRGASFDIRAFHDLVMREGEVPLQTLEDLAAGWGAGETGAPRG